MLAEADPAKRIWLIGEPHNLPENEFRIDMAKAFAAPTMYPGDAWTLLTDIRLSGEQWMFFAARHLRQRSRQVPTRSDAAW